MTLHDGAEERMPSILSVQQIRVVEIVSIFFIVFVAREIAGFVFRTGLVISVFLGATLLNLLAAGLENARFAASASSPFGARPGNGGRSSSTARPPSPSSISRGRRRARSSFSS